MNISDVLIMLAFWALGIFLLFFVAVGCGDTLDIPSVECPAPIECPSLSCPLPLEPVVLPYTLDGDFSSSFVASGDDFIVEARVIIEEDMEPRVALHVLADGERVYDADMRRQ